MSLTLELYKSTLPAIDQIINRKLEALPKMKGFGRVEMEEEVNDLQRIAKHLEMIFEKADQLIIADKTELTRAQNRERMHANLYHQAAIEAEKKGFNALYFFGNQKVGREAFLPLKEISQKVINSHQKMISHEDPN